MELGCDVRPPGYELFFAPLEVRFDPTTLERVRFAYICSKHGHAKQVRDGGTATLTIQSLQPGYT
jgi:hypothetical protein